jgi:excisionase family DNA binding protein
MADPRFLTLPDVAEVLNVSLSQVRALIRRQELKCIRIGGRGQYRVERAELESYIARMYEQTREFLASQPPGEDADDTAGLDELNRTGD